MAFFVQVIVTCMEQTPIHLLYSQYDRWFFQSLNNSQSILVNQHGNNKDLIFVNSLYCCFTAGCNLNEEQKIWESIYA